MSTYTQIIYQIVFAPKYRNGVMVNGSKRQQLYKYIWGVLRNNQCIAYEINGVEDHIHIATHIHPTISLSSLVKDIKVSSSLWIKKNNVFPNFSGWAIGYGAFTYTIKEKMHWLITSETRKNITGSRHLMMSIKNYLKSIR